MPSDSSPEFGMSRSLTHESRGPRASAWMAALAIVLLAGNFLLISPDPAAEALRPWPEGSWLLQVVRAQSMWYLLPTQRGVEIKELIFHVGACLLSFIGLAALLWRCIARPPDSVVGAGPSGVSVGGGWAAWLRHPLTWFAALVVIGLVSAWRATAPGAALGGTIVRYYWLAWWWPLALLLTPRDARRVLGGLCIAAGATAAIGLWYRSVRAPDAPLGYPFGNQLFLAAGLLPALLICSGMAVWRLLPLMQRWFRVGVEDSADANAPSPHRVDSPHTSAALRRTALRNGLAWLVPAAVLLIVLLATQSRSAKLGFGVGLMVIVYLLADRSIRNWLLVVLALAVGSGLGVLLLTKGDVLETTLALMDQLTGRSASIRARIEHEWPFAVTLAGERPWLGHGEGGFGRRVGPLFRAQQMDDPMVLSADGVSWESHAHNELLETLVSLGAFGAAALIAAIYLTFRAAAAARSTGPLSHERRAWLTLAIGGLAAICAESMTDVAMHKPGPPPIALTIWACTWALARGESGATAHCRAGSPESASNGLAPVELEDAAFARAHATRDNGSAAPYRLVAAAALCLLLVVNTMALGLAAFNGWAAHDSWQADRLLARGDPRAATFFADRAAQWRLDPARYLNTLFKAIQCRIAAAQRLSVSNDLDDLQALAELGEQTLQHIDQLHQIAPRYLQAHEFEGVAAALTSSAYQRGARPDEAARMAERSRRAFRLNREDEPFRMQAVAWLWQADVGATATERVGWLRDVLRGGDVGAEWVELLAGIGDELHEAARPFVERAERDLTRAARGDGALLSNWEDRLSPESLRLAAHERLLAGDANAAAELAKQAAVLYSHAAAAGAGNRLARAHAAALHEQVRFSLFAGRGDAVELLATLHRAFQMGEGVSIDGPLPGVMGRTRLQVLLAAGDHPSAAAQAARLVRERSASSGDAVVADALIELVTQVGRRAPHALLPRLLDWSAEAVRRDSRRSDGFRLLLGHALALGRDDLAAFALRGYRQAEPRTGVADAEVARLRSVFPAAGIWSVSAASSASAVDE